ncbi:MAG: methyl-accepting chemotaxis protein [Pelotomaculum sp.]|nr:methyl-accepting chemotaxis protein [Pelotomaculum sp.]
MVGKVTGSLRLRMTILFGLVVLIGCLVLALVSEFKSTAALEGEAKEAMLKVARQAAETVDSQVRARVYVLEVLANNSIIRGVSAGREAALEEKLSVLREAQKAAEGLGFKEFTVVDREGNGNISNGGKVYVADREYFKTALSGKLCITSTLISKADNSVVFSYNLPIRHHATGEITGVLTGIVDGAKFSELIGTVTYGRTGHALAVDGAGKIIAHKDAERVRAQENIVEQAASNKDLASLAAVVAKMAKGEEGVEGYVLQGQNMLIAYAPVKTTGWSVAVTAPVNEVLERAAGLKWAMLAVSLAIIVLALVLTYVMAKTVADPLSQAVNYLGQLAEGNFTSRVQEKHLKRNDEIGRLAQAVDRMWTSLREMFLTIREDAQNLAANSEELAASAEEVSATVEEVASTTGEVASMAEKSLENASRTAEESRNVVAVAESGGATVGKTIEKINSIAASAARMGESVQNLGELSARIGNITDVITGIADQTNLLALNAAIEAARAGEQGRGFAVVAEEVRKLAEQSADAAKEIGQLIGQIQSGVEAAVKAMEYGSAEVKDGVELASQAGAALRDIIGAVNKNIGLMEEIIQGARQASEGMQQLSASNEQVTSTIQQVAGATQQLAEIAGRLQASVNRFKI